MKHRSAACFLSATLFAIVAAGCLPSSCNRHESRALYPADSTSRRLAESTPIDTLLRVRSIEAPPARPWEYPRTVLFDEDGGLLVSDAAADLLYELDSEGAFRSIVSHPDFRQPYLIGSTGDSVFVFSPGSGIVHAVVEGVAHPVTRTPEPPSRPGLLQYALVSEGGLFVKLLGDEFPGFVALLDLDGKERLRFPMGGPPWRHAGLLRAWGDSVLSLRGYRPVVDILTSGGTLDTLRLEGFDSPMLARSRLFSLGLIDAPPLLSASAATLGDSLYVLNMRPGWLRVDVYGRDGRLRRILTQPDPSFLKNFYPTDIAVRRLDASTVRVAVSVVDPAPRVDLYDWRTISP